jgi:Cu-processing system permease protein
VFLIPLIALLLAYDSIVGEDERGTLLLLLSYPLSRTTLLTGKFLGHGAILAVSTGLGFGVAGLVIALFSDHGGAPELWLALALFIVSATLLGWSFVAMAYVVSVFVTEKSRAAALALVVWFAFVLVFDLALLGLLVTTGSGPWAQIVPYLLLLNPTDVFRLANLTSFDATLAHSGLVSIGATFRLPELLAALGAWVLGPFALAVWLFDRRAI